MNRQYRENEQLRLQLKSAQAELQELEKMLNAFENQVDVRLGDLLDQLSLLNAETFTLDQELRGIREQRLFGEDVIRYLDGAPRPARPLNLNDLPPMVLQPRDVSTSPVNASAPSNSLPTPDIKTLYRRLARRYHPDLTRTEADRRLSNEQMVEVNQAYSAGDLQTLIRLAGFNLPLQNPFQEPTSHSSTLIGQPKTEQEQVEENLKTVRQEIARLSRLPIVKLSLDVKLARHQRRDLLGEMAYDLQRKVGRKIAERDYLRSQINAARSMTNPENHHD